MLPAKSRPARTSAATTENAWTESANAMPGLLMPTALFSSARRIATTTAPALTTPDVSVNQNGLVLAAKKKCARRNAANTASASKACATVRRNGLAKLATNRRAPVAAIPAANASTVPASANSDGVVKPVTFKNALGSALTRPTENATRKRSNVHAKKDGLEKTAARNLAPKTATATVSAKTVSASAKTCGLVLHASSLHAPILAQATVCVSETDASVTRNLKETIAPFANAPTRAVDAANALRKMTSNVNALRHSPAKTVVGKRALKGAMPPTVSASFRPAPRARKSANACVLMDGLAPTACRRDARRDAPTASASKENANATVVSWAMRAIWPAAPTTATTMASATPPVALPCANVNRVTTVKLVAKKTAPTIAQVTVCVMRRNAHAPKDLVERTAPCVNAHQTI